MGYLKGAGGDQKQFLSAKCHARRRCENKTRKFRVFGKNLPGAASSTTWGDVYPQTQ
jgi:hypothetical protein